MKRRDLIAQGVFAATLPMGTASCSRTLEGKRKGMSYTKIVTREDGETYFEDVDLPNTSEAAEVVVPTQSCVSWEIGQGPSSETNDFHTTKVPKILLVLEGALEIGVSTGEVRRFVPGDVLHPTDTTGRGHTAKRLGDPLCRVLVISTA